MFAKGRFNGGKEPRCLRSADEHAWTLQVTASATLKLWLTYGVPKTAPQTQNDTDAPTRRPLGGFALEGQAASDEPTRASSEPSKYLSWAFSLGCSRFSTPAKPMSAAEAHAGHCSAQLPTQWQSSQR